MSVTLDPVARKYVPATTAEWTELLANAGLNAPSSIWLCQETSGTTLADSGSAGRTVTLNGSPTLGDAPAGWSRTGVKCADGSATQYGTFTGPTVGASSVMLLQMFALNSTATAARGLNRLGTATAGHATLQSGNKLRGTSDANTSDGDRQYAGTMIVITKLDVNSEELGVYTAYEQIKPTYATPSGSTTFYLFGDGTAASDATLVYAALWADAGAEISDSQIVDLLAALNGSETTIEKMQAGSFAMKWVATIEGCKYILSDAPAAAVVNAYAGTDWDNEDNVIQGLYVELHNEQSIAPLEPFTTMGRCTLRVQDGQTGDVFGRFVAQRQGGDRTTITSTADRNDTTINVKSTTDWASSGDAFIGTECFGYTGVGATSFTGCTRGKYSPFRCAQSGSGGNRFGNHHRVGTDINHVQLNPVVSSIPRIWIGKRVAVRLHTWDEENQALNSRAEAQLVFAGRISALSDDHNTFETIIEVDHAMSEFRNAIIGRDIMAGEIAPGLALIANRTIRFKERKTGSAAVEANVLEVVAGVPANTNEIQAGTYSLSELCEALNRWLGEECRAGRISGYYSFSSPVATGDGARTKCHWTLANASSTIAVFPSLYMPSEMAAFLGFTDSDPDNSGMQVQYKFKPAYANEQAIETGLTAPFTTLIFGPSGPGRHGQEFSTGSQFYDCDKVRGTFMDQYSRLPAPIKTACSPSAEWGVFLLDEKHLVVGTFDNETKRLRNCWLAPLKASGAGADPGALNFIGRRADERDAGPIRIRQVFAFEGTAAGLLLELAYSSGVSGYNHADYDTFASGFGIGMPGELLGPEFELSLINMPGADAPRHILLDEPTKFSELVGGDLNFIWTFLRWKDQHFEFCNWKTPLNALAVATLSEDNKAGPADANHRVASQETDEHQRSVIKIDYDRDFGFGRSGEFFSSFMFQDQTAVDDAGGSVKPATIALRNVFYEFANAGSSVEAGLPSFMAHMPSVSRPSREIARTFDQRYFEQIAPGDIFTFEDEFARDPLTGMRGVNTRAAFITRAGYDLGGPTPDPNGDVRLQSGNVVANFLDTQRGEYYAPAADIDETANAGGFSAGYNSGVPSIRCYEHHYSHDISYPTWRGIVYDTEDADASNFAAGDKILIIERDPADPANPTYWERTVDSVSGNDITLTATLSSPAWDSAKRYRVTYQKYSQIQDSQEEACFQADDDDEWVEDLEIPFHFSCAPEDADYSANSTAVPGEFVPDLCYGDGRPWDVGHDQAIARTANAFIDYKSAHQTPFLWPSTILVVDTASTAWATFFFGPIFLGTEHLSSSVVRTLTVAPFFRSTSAGSTGKVRVVLMSDIPVISRAEDFSSVVDTYRSPILNGRYAVSSEWSTTSDAWQTGADATVDLNVKDITFGMAWILVQGTGYAECRGLARCIEGPRAVIAPY
jgi:hypothetical protein